jgi:hypothetical protein
VGTVADQFNILDRSLDDPDALTTGEGVYSRALAGISTALATGDQNLRLTYFTAKKTETITQVRVITGTTAAVGATLIRIGVWTADAAGALLAQVAATPNDTALLAATNTAYTKAFSASFMKQTGQRYACGLLAVTAVTAPTMTGHATGIQAGEAGLSPKISGLIAAQADLPATAAAGGVAGSATRPYFVLLP